MKATTQVRITTEVAETGRVWFNVFFGDQLMDAWNDPSYAGEVAKSLMQAEKNGQAEAMLKQYEAGIGK